MITNKRLRTKSPNSIWSPTNACAPNLRTAYDHQPTPAHQISQQHMITNLRLRTKSPNSIWSPTNAWAPNLPTAYDHQPTPAHQISQQHMITNQRLRTKSPNSIWWPTNACAPNLPTVYDHQPTPAHQISQQHMITNQRLRTMSGYVSRDSRHVPIKCILQHRGGMLMKFLSLSVRPAVLNKKEPLCLGLLLVGPVCHWTKSRCSALLSGRDRLSQNKNKRKYSWLTTDRPAWKRTNACSEHRPNLRFLRAWRQI
jgi:hypothetical protein